MIESAGSAILAKFYWLAQSLRTGCPSDWPHVETPAAFADAVAAICRRSASIRAGDGMLSPSAQAINDLLDFMADDNMLSRLRQLPRFPPEPARAAAETSAGEFWNLAALIQNVFEHATSYNPTIDDVVLALSNFGVETVYDFGSGAGHLAFVLAHRGILVTCVDRNAVARRFLDYRRSRHRLEDLVSLRPYRRPYDAIAAIHVLDHLADPAAMIASLARRLRPGGLLIAAATFSDDGWHTADSASIGCLARQLRANFVYRAPGGDYPALLEMAKRRQTRPQRLSRADPRHVRVRLNPAATFVALPESADRILITAPHAHVTPLVVTAQGASLARACASGPLVADLLQNVQQLETTEILEALRRFESCNLLSIETAASESDELGIGAGVPGQTAAASLEDRARNLLLDVLTDRTDGAKFIRRPVSFVHRNEALLRANFLKTKADRLQSLLDAFERPLAKLDLSGGHSHARFHAGALHRANDALRRARISFAGTMADLLPEAVLQDPEFFCYADLCLSGFGVLRPAIAAELGMSEKILQAARDRFMDAFKAEILVDLKRGLAARLARIFGVTMTSDDLVITAGSSVYLAPHVLSALMRPGDTLLAPEFTFYGTLNCILPLFAGLAGSDDCSVGIVRTDGSTGGKISIDHLEQYMESTERRAGFRRPSLLWLTSPTNLGAIYSARELEALADFAQRHNLNVVCDEAFAGLTNRATYLSPWTIEAFGDRLVCIGTSSKIFDLYDGDHILYTDLGASDHIFTEDVNVWAGGVSYFMTRSRHARQAISRAIADHPFTLMRALFASNIIGVTPDGYFEAKNDELDRNRDFACARIPKMSDRSGLPLRPVGTPQSGYHIGLQFDARALRRAGVTDAAQLAGYFRASANVKLDVMPSTADAGQIVLRINASKDRDVIEAAFARIERAAASLLTTRNYLDSLPADAREIADEAFDRRWRALADGLPDASKPAANAADRIPASRFGFLR